jgi:hypothetical protein
MKQMKQMKPNKSKKYFGNIVIQQKSEDDFRSFAHVCDSIGQWWELRGYGKTPSDTSMTIRIYK